jgi:TorA maturation chaperone TorD
MREEGLQRAIDAAGGVGALARRLGISQPSVSAWTRVPADRVVAVEAVAGVPRHELRPDLYPDSRGQRAEPTPLDEVDQARADELRLVAHLLAKPPSAAVLARAGQIRGDATPLGIAHLALAEAAREASEATVGAEYFNLFVGIGRGELLPYASYYLTGFLHERPLARVREDLARLGIERQPGNHEPEDHVATLLEVMAGLIDGSLAGGVAPGEDTRFFVRHLKPWTGRFFADLAAAPSSRFYRAVAAVGGTLIDIETEAAELAAA